MKREWRDPATGTLKSGNTKSQDEKVLWRYAARIPKGTTVYKGPVESQGGVFMGGFSVEQVYIPKPWLLQAKGASITEKRLFERNGATSGERNNSAEVKAELNSLRLAALALAEICNGEKNLYRFARFFREVSEVAVPAS